MQAVLEKTYRLRKRTWHLVYRSDREFGSYLLDSYVLALR